MVKKILLVVLFVTNIGVNLNAEGAPRLHTNQAINDATMSKKMYKDETNNKFYIDYMDANQKNDIQFNSLPNKISDQILMNPSGFSKVELQPTPVEGDYSSTPGWIDNGYDDATMTNHYSINPTITDFSKGDVKIIFRNSGLVFENSEYHFVDIVMTIKSADVFMDETNPNYQALISSDTPPQVGFNIKYKIYQNGDFRIPRYDSFQITNDKLDDVVVGFEFLYSSDYASEELREKPVEGKSVTFIIDYISNGGSISFLEEEYDYSVVNECLYELNYQSFGKCQEFSYPVQTAEHNQVSKEDYQVGKNQLAIKNKDLTPVDPRLGFYSQDGYLGFMDTWFWPAQTTVFSKVDQKTNSQVQVGFKDAVFDLHLINQNQWWGYDKMSSDMNKASGTTSTYTFDSPDNSILLTRPKMQKGKENTVIQIPLYNYGGAQTPLNISARFPNHKNFQNLSEDNIKVISMEQVDYFDYVMEHDMFLDLPSIAQLEEGAKQTTLKKWDYNRDFYLYDSLFSDRIVFNRVILENHIAIVEITIDNDFVWYDKYDFNLCSGFLNCSSQQTDPIKD